MPVRAPSGEVKNAVLTGIAAFLAGTIQFPGLGTNFALETIAPRPPMPAGAMIHFMPAFAGSDRMFETIRPDGRFGAGQAKPMGFLAHHVDLLTGHRRAVSLQHVGEPVENFVAAVGPVARLARLV